MAENGELKIDILPQIAAVARPGDTILIGFDRSMTDDELIELRESFKGFTEVTGVHVGYIEHATSMVVCQGHNAHEVQESDDAFLPVYVPESADLDKEFPDGE